ncbi:MAG: prolyl oligopeptidase family serine peptidase [Planctomycetota bacterium]
MTHRALIAIALLLLAASPAVSQDDASEAIVVKDILVIGGVVRSQRSPVFEDPIEAALVAGTFTAPKEGDEIPGGRQPRVWERMTSDDGSFGSRGLGSGYAFATIESSRERVMLLEARGHRHLYLNGEPRGGDVYNLGLTRWPVLLRRGVNELLIRGGRGNLQVRFVPPPAPVFLEPLDALLPQIIRGETEPAWASIQVTNASNAWQADLQLALKNEAGERALTMRLPPIGPCTARKIPVQVPAGIGALRFELLSGRLAILHELEPIELPVKDPGEKHVRTFFSEVDHSVQAYAVTPAKAGDSERPLGIVLSLHGAGVDGRNQAHHYQPTDWAHIVSPTNRRPFGFDWEDWGRLDALEALADARQRFGADPATTALTGHSMGGHGTWQLGVHYPGHFAAIGPSAGWRDFWSYAGARQSGEEAGPVEKILDRAVNTSRTLLLEQNLAARGVYVLHGDRDDNVPVSQARFMRERLAQFHPNFAYYERPGAGHWWGDPCMDWPPLMEFLKRNTPLPETVDRVDYRTVNPAVSSKLHWVTILAQERSLDVSRVTAERRAADRPFEIQTENVRRLQLDLEPGAEASVKIDGAELEVIAGDSGRVLLEKGTDGWQTSEAFDDSLKGPHRAGPFKEAYRHGVILVVGTEGDEDENAWAYAKARHDAETFAYRGNGAFPIILDVDLDLEETRDRNLVLYGNAETNAAWSQVLEGCPIEVRRGSVRVGERAIDGDDLAVLMVYPKDGSPDRSVGVVAGTGDPGSRLTHQLPYFVSGVAYPDWTILSSAMLEEGIDGVRAAGFFDHDWSLGDDYAIREP